MFGWVRVRLAVDTKKERGLWPLSFLVPVTGLEPVLCRQRRILSPLRLPFHHTGSWFIQYSTHPGKKQAKVFVLRILLDLQWPVGDNRNIL